MSGFIDIQDRYDRLFELSNLINLAAVFFIIKSWNYFATNKVNIKEEIKKGRFGLALVLLIIPILLSGFYCYWLANDLILFIGVAALFYISILGRRLSTTNERNKIYSFVFLTGSSIVFWMLYFVGPMGVTQFLKYNVQVYLGSYYIPPQWLMNLNSLFVIIGSPLAVLLFEKLRKNQIPISISKQFMCALLFIAFSFLVLVAGIVNSNSSGVTHVGWVIVHYLFQGVGELLIAPVGYAMIGSLAPEKLQGVMMGIWMMASGIAVTLSNYFSNVMTESESINPLISNEHYMSAFTQLGLYATVSAFVIWFFSKTIENSLPKDAIKLSEAVA
jgi:POT family proton-dependent oligopeptide transporter/mRNA interferase RelE/StbE